ncbi:MAG: 50S ribosomal protein L29 [Candidatus Andersenbacteria bacterium]
MPKVLSLSDIRRKSPQERTSLVVQLRHQLREARFEQHAGSLTKVRTIRELRRSIAKVLTIK